MVVIRLSMLDFNNGSWLSSVQELPKMLPARVASRTIALLAIPTAPLRGSSGGAEPKSSARLARSRRNSHGKARAACLLHRAAAVARRRTPWMMVGGSPAEQVVLMAIVLVVHSVDAITLLTIRIALAYNTMLHRSCFVRKHALYFSTS